MKSVSFYPWFLSTMLYGVGIYFGFKDLHMYFTKYILGPANMTDTQTYNFVVLSVACLLATYNYVNYSKRYFKKVFKSKRH